MYKIILHIFKTLQFVLTITLDNKTKCMYQNHFVLYFFLNFMIYSCIYYFLLTEIIPLSQMGNNKKGTSAYNASILG